MNDTYILFSVKRYLGVANDDTSFDIQIAACINNALGVLTQLGLPTLSLSSNQNGEIVDRQWSELTTRRSLQGLCRSKIFAWVKMEFDLVSTTGAAISSFKDRMDEMDWRITLETYNSV